MNAAEQFAQVRAVSTPIRRVLIRQVAGGYAITGQESWKQGSNVLAEVDNDGVAMDRQTAVNMANNWFIHGNFDDPLVDPEDEVQPELFDEPGAVPAITAGETPPTKTVV